MPEHDFAALRAARNANLRRIVAEVAEEWSVPPAALRHNFDFDACYCACPVGPCEHDFAGWREFEDGRGGEGAMAHTMRTAP